MYATLIMARQIGWLVRLERVSGLFSDKEESVDLDPLITATMASKKDGQIQGSGTSIHCIGLDTMIMNILDELRMVEGNFMGSLITHTF